MARRKFSRLKSALYEAELTQADVARACGRGKTYISRRLNGREPFNVADMATIGGLLGLPQNQWLNYFVDSSDKGNVDCCVIKRMASVGESGERA